MRVDELMIGDWVLKDMNYSEEDPIYAKLDYRPYQIMSGEDIDIAIESNCMGDGSIYLPIPLTKEILEKNGLEKVIDEDGTECYRYYNRAADGYVKISLYDGGDSDWSIEIINYEKFNDNEIVYNNNFTFLKVHEFQHALCLCKLNEFANNFELI